MSSERAAHTLQGAILDLTRFWTEQGCLLLPGCDLELSAATLHPETFFHLLGDDPWRATYVQPVRRPLDGRRRDHPFRFLKHLQLQVVLKPAPRDVRALYLESLEALGCRLAVHDLRFAEWRWEARAIDAWGSGWRVLIDGLGVTRLTFLQQVAGRDLEPIAVELSYGLERIAMLLGDRPSADDVPWGPEGPAYGDLRRREEAELSRYAFEAADADAVHLELELSSSEADRCLVAGLARPAYERILQALRALDLLEARGFLGTADRDRWWQKLREMVGAVAGLHLDGRPEDREGDGAESAGESTEVPETESAGVDAAPDSRAAAEKPARGKRGRKRRRTADGE